MKVLIAPDSFKDALTAPEVCAALARGVRDARPDAQIASCPMGDGGEGTGPVLAQALNAREEFANVVNPRGRPRRARWWSTLDGRTAIIEMAEASGLWLLRPNERDPLRTTSYGTGQLIQAARVAGAESILVCVGGSATVDGGVGCLQALGWSFRDEQRHEVEVPATGRSLARIATATPPEDTPRIRLEVLCDVDNPLCGPQGAAKVFAPQKGAGPAEVERLAAGLSSWARLLESLSGHDVRSLPGTGAAGGLPAALLAVPGTRIMPGLPRVAEAVQLDARLRGCNWCLTGEGRLDAQTAGGKVVAGIARRARQQHARVVAFVGTLAGTPADVRQSLGLDDIRVVTPPDTPLRAALGATADNLRRSAAAWAASI